MRKHFMLLLAIAVVVVMALTGCLGPTKQGVTELPEQAPGQAPTTEVPPTEVQPSESPGGLILPPQEVPDTVMVPGVCDVQPPLPDGYNPYGTQFAIKPDGTPYKFAIVPYFVAHISPATSLGIMQSHFRRAGASYTLYDPNFIEADWESMMEDQLVLKPDAIMSMAIDSNASVPVTEQVIETTGIPVFVWDVTINSNMVTSTVVFDEAEGGRMAAEWLIDYAEKKGIQLNVAEVWCIPSMQLAQDRHRGFHEIADARPDIFLEVIEGEGNANIEDSRTFIEDAFTTHPELNVVYSHGGYGLGVSQGLRAVGRYHVVGDPDHVVVYHLDVFPDILDPVKKGYFDICTSHSVWELGDLITKIAFTNVVLGCPVPKEVIEQRYEVTLENYDNSVRWGARYHWGDMYNYGLTDFDNWPVLEVPPDLLGGIPTPTTEMRQELLGY